MIQVQIAGGDLAGAQQTLAILSQYDVDIVGHETAMTLAQRAELQYLQGDRIGAGRWVDAFTAPVVDQPLYQQQAQIVRVRLLLARGTAADVQTAQVTITALIAVAERTYNTRFHIALLALRALALDAEGQERTAQACLRDAIELAQARGFIRTFVDLGPRLHALLRRLARRGVATGYLEQILNAFPALPSHFSPPFSPSQGPAASNPLVEPLTDREIDVLALLAQRLSAKEIAAQLVIAEGTVNRHVANIYSKLAVNNRRQAVAVAIALGLLPA
jgi:LuxR family maltose regulon positive regulatory protein